MAWVCWAHVFLRLAPEPETKAACFKQDKVGKMEHFAAMILSELFRCFFHTVLTLEKFCPHIPPPAHLAKTHIGQCRNFFHPCVCQRF